MQIVMVLYSRKVVSAEVEALIDHFANSARYQLLVACADRSLPQNLSDDALLRGRFVDLAGVEFQPVRRAQSMERAPATTFRTSLRDKIRRAALGIGAARAIFLGYRLWRHSRRALRLLERYRPVAAVVFGDRSAVPEMTFLKMARRLGLPSLLLPFAASSVESDLSLRKGQQTFMVEAGQLRWLRRWLASRYPHQVEQGPDGPMLFFGFLDSIAMAAFGLLKGRSWINGGGDVTAVGVFGPDDAASLVAYGLDAGKVHLTGQVSLDVLVRERHRAEALRSELAARYFQGASKPLMICAVPHYAEHGQLDWPVHMEQTEALFRAIGDSGANGLLSLHPKSMHSTYAPLAKRYGLVIADAPLKECLPAADIFVSGYSSTVRWAAMLGIATVLVDIAGLGYTMYDELTALHTVTDAENLAQVLARLARNSDDRNAMAGLLGEQGRSFGILDGCSCRRVEDVINGMVGSCGTS